MRRPARDSHDPRRARPPRRGVRPTFPLGLVIVVAAFGAVSCGSDDDAGGTTETTTQTTTTPTTETTTKTETTETTTTQPPRPQPTTIRVRIVDGTPQGGIVRKSVDRGDRVVFVVTSDVYDHVHVHGYDRFADLGPGRRARIAFRARIPGRFVVELEDRHTQIAELTVTP
jgi:hypothetical protein